MLRLHFFLLTCSIAIAAVSNLGCTEAQRSTSPAVPRATAVFRAAESRLLDLHGQPFSLGQQQGQVVVAIFTRSDCPISNRYAPEIRTLYEVFHPRGVEFYLVYVDPREGPAAIRAHLQEYDYPCPAVRDPDHWLATATGATVTPEAVVFDPRRRIAYRGRIDDQHSEIGQSRPARVQGDLAAAIEATLSGQPVAEPVTKAVGCYITDLK